MPLFCENDDDDGYGGDDQSKLRNTKDIEGAGKKENGGFHFQRRQRGGISFAANAEVETIIKRERTNAQSLWLGSEKI